MALAVVASMASAPLGADDRFFDYDTGVQFGRFRTFAVVSGAITSRAPELDNAITRKGVVDTLRSRLVAKKLREVPAAAADLVVTWSMGAEPRRGSRPARPGRPRRVPFIYNEGTLVIEMTSREGSLVWLGIYRDDERSTAKLAENLPRNVARLLDDFPPKR